MMLGETVTYLGLDGRVPVWEHPYAVCMCPVALMGELGQK